MSTSPTAPHRQYERWERFRTGRNAALATPHGWLTLTSFQWLPATPTRLPGVPGLWSADTVTARLTADGQDGLILPAGGEPVTGTLTAALADEESLLWVQHGTVVIELGMRAGRFMIRTRDAAAATLRDFRGVPVFDYTPELVFTATFEPFAAPRQTTIATSRPEVPGSVRLLGEVVFRHAGREHRLAAEEGPLGSLIVTFFDGSNGDTTAPWRKVELTRPRPDNTVVVDFNRAINYPSAFTDFGTCPAPVPGNRLPFAVPAGERKVR